LVVVFLAGCNFPGRPQQTEVNATTDLGSSNLATTEQIGAGPTTLPVETEASSTQIISEAPTRITVLTATSSQTATQTQPLTLTSTLTPTQTSTHTPTPTHKPTPVLTATPTPVTGELQTQLVSGGVLAIVPDPNKTVGGCPTWAFLSKKLKTPSLPYVHDLGRAGEYGGVCVYGVPFQDGLKFIAIRPNETQAGSASAHAEDQGGGFYSIKQDTPVQTIYDGGATINNEVPVVWYRIWLPPGLPTGNWTMRVNGSGVRAKGTFKVDSYPPQPAIGIIKPKVGAYPADTSPFDRPAGQEATCPEMQLGEPFSVYMVNLNPGASFTVGLYVRYTIYYELVRAYPFTVNRKGNQEIKVQVNPDDPQGLPPGHFVLVLVLDPATKGFSDAGPATCFNIVQN